jgi:hypothetical protein
VQHKQEKVLPGDPDQQIPGVFAIQFVGNRIVLMLPHRSFTLDKNIICSLD